jgi:hypothetical protein
VSVLTAPAKKANDGGLPRHQRSGCSLRSKRDASYQLVRSTGMGGWPPNISIALALEYEDVLKRKGVLPMRRH